MKLRTYFAVGLLVTQQLLMPIAIAATVSAPQAQAAPFVLPSTIGAKEPFTFSATGVLEGEVIEIKSVEGEVVETKKPDKLGRVFIAAGLAAGTYLLSRGGGKGQTQCTIEPPRQIPTGGLQIQNPPAFVDAQTGIALEGQGFNANAASNALSCGSTQVPVLASTATEIKTGPLSNVPKGRQDISVKNSETGESQKLDNTIVYSLQAKLTKQKVANGEQFQLQFNFEPKTLDASVNARILGGPVHFAQGKNEAQVLIHGGLAMVPLFAAPAGLGKFRVAYYVETIGNPGEVLMMMPPNPCPATKHILIPNGAKWEVGSYDTKDPFTGKKGKQWYAYRKLVCWLHSCTLSRDHGGDHKWKKTKKCTDTDAGFEDVNGNGKYDKNDGVWDPKKDDTNKDGKPSEGEYDDNDGDGKYDPPEPIKGDKDPKGEYHGGETESQLLEGDQNNKEGAEKLVKDLNAK